MQKTSLKELNVKRFLSIFATFLVVAFVFGVGVPQVFFSDAATGPNIMNYQGRVLNANGVPVTNASVDVVFELHTTLATEACVWSNSSATCASSTVQAVTLTDGLFSEALGDTGDGYASLAGIFEANPNLYLDVTIEGETLTPRQRLVAAPYAVNASALNGLDSDAFTSASGDSVTGSYTFTQTTADTAIFINQDGNTGTAIDDTDGGALHISNTGNNNSGLTVYSNNGPFAASPLAHVFADNALFTQDVLRVQNDGSGIGLRIIQDVVDAPASGSVGNQALLIDVNEVAGNDDVIIIRSDADGTADTEFIFENDGDAFADGAWTGGGADFAEYFDSADPTLNDYDLVCSSAVANKVEKCSPGNRSIIGVISTNPAFVANSRGAEISAEEETRPLVGLVGQITTHVTNENGPINIGDPIAVSDVLSGHGAKADSAGGIIGYALEAFDAESGLMLVYVNPTWHAGAILEEGIHFAEDIVLAPNDPNNAFTTLGSSSLKLFGKTNGQTKGFTINTDVASSDAYSLRIQNELNESLLELKQNGDLALSGKLFLANESGFQSDAYLIYDGDEILADGYIRTNAAGFSSESFDFAEMFAIEGTALPGDVLVFAGTSGTVRAATSLDSDQKIAGIVSTQPGFLAGKKQEGQVPVALSGRVPTKVTNENGAISVGDPLTISSQTGHAMKATNAGTIIGYALEPSSQRTDLISVFVRASYFAGSASEGSSLTIGEDLDLNNGRILAVNSIQGVAGKWVISANGDFYTRGKIGQYLSRSGGGESLLYPPLGSVQTLQLTGQVTMKDGYAKVEFEKYDKAFNNLISQAASYQVFVTPNGLTGQVYVDKKDKDSFIIREVGAKTSTEIDWLVIAYPKDFIPPESDGEEAPEDTDTETGEEEPEVVEETVEPSEETVEETDAITDEVVTEEEPLHEETVEPEVAEEIVEDVEDEEIPAEIEEIILEEEIIPDEVPVEEVAAE